MSKNQYYFAYGSNMHGEQMTRRCTDASFVGPACLRDHQLQFTRFSPAWGGGVGDIVPSAGSETWGGLYQISDSDVAALDVHEGHPHVYARSVYQVWSARHEREVDAWAYAVVHKVEPLAPAYAYWRTLIQGARDCGLSHEYITLLEALEPRGSGG